MAKEKKLELWVKEFLHYILNLGAIALIWVPVMNFFGAGQWQVWETLAVALVVFIGVDQLLHKYLLGE